MKETPPEGDSSLLKIHVQISEMNCPETWASNFAEILQVESQWGYPLCGEGILLENWQMAVVAHCYIFLRLENVNFRTGCLALNPTVNHFRAYCPWTS